MKPGPWFQEPPSPLPVGGRVLILGAGLAGSTTAWYLAQHGVSVTVLDKHRQPAMETSSNPAGVILPFISLDNDRPHQFYSDAYGLSQQLVMQQEARGFDLQRNACGILHLLCQPRLAKMHHRIQTGTPHPYALALNAKEANRVAGFPIDQPALYYPRGCALSPAALCRSLLHHPLIKTRFACPIASVDYVSSQWQLCDIRGEIMDRGHVLVLANAHDANTLLHKHPLPIRTTLGQIALVRRPPKTVFPQTIICHRDYMVPQVGADCLIGATWRPDDGATPHMLHADQTELLNACKGTLPALKLPEHPALRGKAGRRATTADHLPLVGPLPNVAAFMETYASLHLGKTAQYPPGPYLPGLYGNLAHGSRGLVSTPLSAAHLAAMICGTPSPLPQTLSHILNPARYLMRYLKRDPSHRDPSMVRTK